MAKVSIPPIRLPWRENDIKSKDPELLADYLKVLNKTLQKKLEEIGSIININATKLEEIESIATIYKMDKNLVGYWPFDEGSGTTAFDSSGHGNDGTIHGASWADGVSGKALSFDGEDDYVVIDQPDIQTSPNLFTVTGWIKPNDSTKMRFITPHSNGLDQFIAYNGTYERLDVILAEAADTNEVLTHSGGGTVPLDVWTHFAVIVNDRNAKIYINGELKQDYTKDTDIAGWMGQWYIGQRGNGTFYYSGLIDEVRIYNRALTAEEIKALYLNHC